MNLTKSFVVAALLCTFGAATFAQAPAGAGPRGTAHPRGVHRSHHKFHMPHWHHVKHAHHAKAAGPHGQ